MSRYLKIGVFSHWLKLAFAGLVVTLAAIPSWAQPTPPVSPKILVLTTHEGGDLDSWTKPDGIDTSNGLARAFGFTGPLITPGSVPPNNPPTFTIPPTVTYKYGILSIRPIKAGETASLAPASNVSYPTAPTQTVRVVNTNANVDSLVYVNDTTPNLAGDLSTDAKLRALFTPAGGGRYDMIVVGSTYYKVVDEAYATLTKVMQDPALKPGSILYFIDSCCDSGTTNSTNMKRFVSDVLNPATSKTLAAVLPTTDSMGVFPLNTPNAPNNPATSGVPTIAANDPDVSQYAPRFKTQLSKIYGGYYSTLSGLPTDNILFRNSNAVVKSGNANVAYGAFFPTPQIYGGNGTCTFAVVDITPFGDSIYGNSYTANTGTGTPSTGLNIGQAFIDAALAGGACGGSASIAASPTSQNVTLASPITPQPITLTITNETLDAAANGNGSVSGARVEAALPAHLALSGALSSTCTDSAGSALTPQVVPASGTQNVGFSITGITLGFQKSCIVTLPVKWADTADLTGPTANACIKTASNTATLTINPGSSEQFSTNQGQVATTVTASVVCTAPELALTTNYVTPTSAIPVGQSVSYDVTVTNLSETATAANAQLTGLVPTGATQTVTPKSARFLKANPTACVNVSDCTLAPGETAAFTVQFNAPASSNAALTWSPTVALTANPPGEVTLNNNSVTLNATLQTSTLTVNAQLNTTGSIPNYASDFAAKPMNFSVTGCTPATATSSGAAPLGASVNAAGSSSPLSILTGTGTCAVSFSNAPNASALPPGYVLSAVSMSAATTDTNGNQTITATWTATPPGAVHISGTVQGAPSTFPASLVGQKVNYSLTCAPSAAIPASGQLTIGANGALTTPDGLVPPGSSCTGLTVDGIAQLPAAPQNYEWKSSTGTSSGTNAFTVTLVMAVKASPAGATPVPTLAQWALYALASLMLLAAASQLRIRNQQRSKR